MNTHRNRRHTYWATSRDMHFYKNHAGAASAVRSGYYIEYNPNIKMYRINHKKGVPLELMGYSSHVKALEEQLVKYTRRHRVCL